MLSSYGPGLLRQAIYPARRIDQVLYDLVASAKRDVLLITFAAHKRGDITVLLRHSNRHDGATGEARVKQNPV